MVELWGTVRAVLDDVSYLVLGTADADGNPWTTPLFFAARGEHRLYWVSAPDSRHSRNLAARPTVAVTVFDSRGPIGMGDAVYLTATARLLDGDAALAGLAVLNGRLPDDRPLDHDDLLPVGPLAVYEAVVDEHRVLVRGGDPRFANEIDTSVRVEPPPSR